MLAEKNLFCYHIISEFEDSERERERETEKSKYDIHNALVERRFVWFLCVVRRKWVNTDDTTTSERTENNKAEIRKLLREKVFRETTKIFLSSFRMFNTICEVRPSRTE
jgi:hypothetical protein